MVMRLPWLRGMGGEGKDGGVLQAGDERKKREDLGSSPDRLDAPPSLCGSKRSGGAAESRSRFGSWC